MTFPQPDDDTQALASLAAMHRQNKIAAQPGGWPTPHIDVEQRTTDFTDSPESGPFSSAGTADAEFRRALADGAYPVVPAAVTAALGAPDRLLDLAAAPRRGQLPGDVVRVTVEALLVGRHVDPAEFTDAVTEAHRHAEVAPAIRRVHNTVREQLRDGWQGVVAGALPALLGGLRDQLEELLVEARAAYAALDGLQVDSSPVAVAAAGDQQRKALLALDDLSARYDRLRRGQMAATAAASPDSLPGSRASGQRLDEPTTWAGIFALELHEFREVGRRGAIGSGVTGTARLAQVVRRDDVWLPDRLRLDEVYLKVFAGTTANDGGSDAA